LRRYFRLLFLRTPKLLVGPLLTPGPRAVAALRALELSHLRQFQNYHRVLNRATWSPRQAALILLHLLNEILRSKLRGMYPKSDSMGPGAGDSIPGERKRRSPFPLPVKFKLQVRAVSP
jgi:hypothetical protein